MITLRDKGTGRDIGSVAETQLQFLVDRLEEEDSDDQDYWLNRETIDSLRAAGADAELVEVLETAIGDGDELEIEWVRS